MGQPYIDGWGVAQADLEPRWGSYALAEQVDELEAALRALKAWAATKAS